MSNEQARLALAFALTGIIFFSWQHYFSPKQENFNVSQETAQTNSVIQEQKTSKNTETDVKQKSEDLINEKTFKLSNNENYVVIDNRLRVVDFYNTNTFSSFQDIVQSKTPFKIYFSDSLDSDWKEVFLNEELSSSNSNVSLKNIKSEISLSQSINENGDTKGKILLNKPQFIKFELNTPPGEAASSKFREFILLDKSVTRIKVGDKKDGELELSWAGIDFNYHIFNFVLSNKVPAKYETTEDGKLIIVLMKPMNQIDLDFVFVKKNYDYLSKFGKKLELAVDFGMFGILAVPMLHVLQFFYKILPNYGVAIMLLTILLRILTFPLTYSSFKNMKKMQQIQPELNKIREKFKEEPQRMQKESMELFKRSGVNPLSGCLPMLLQIPFFFAFYRMLNGAIELVGAPFIFWIRDLSLKDPFYVLPILMTVTFFVQQKITPNATMDPMQRKMMLFMPLVFGLMMKELPAALTLYIFVTTLFGIGQQFFVAKVNK